ncbi:MAG: efflux RND transporter permease subunit [Steroidobacteraceae bacterium]
MSLWSFAVGRWQFTLVLFTLLGATGLTALNAIPRAEDPSLTFPGSLIVVAYPGADPVDIERLVVEPIEDALQGLDNIEKIASTSSDGVATIQVEFNFGVDPDRKYDEVIREVNRLRPALPPDLLDLKIQQFKPSLTNMVQMALLSDTAEWRELREIAEDLQDTIEAVPGIRIAEVWALPEPEVRVAVDLARLASAQVSLGQLIDAIRGQSTVIPGGAVDLGARRFNLKTSGGYESLEQVRKTVVAARDGRVVRVGDLAPVSWSTAAARYLGRFSGSRAVFVTANMKDKENVFVVRDGVYAKLDAFERLLPEGVRLERGFDQSRNVERRLSQLQFDFALAISLVALTLLPLGLRAAGIVMMSIPLSLAMGMAFLYFTGFTLNQLSIAGFVVALGLLVDDSIVVVENISRHIREGTPRRQAAVAATSQIWLAVLGCTATLILAFLPLLFLPEESGEFVRSLPAAVIYTVIASLFVSLTIIPFLASRLLRGEPRPLPQQPWLARLVLFGRRLLDGSDRISDRTLDRVMATIHAVYGPALRTALTWPRTTFWSAMALFGGAVLLALYGMNVSLFPNAGIPQFRIRIEAPEGASLAETDRALRYVEEELARRPEIKHWFANLGHENPRVYYNVVPRSYAANIAEVLVELERYKAGPTGRLLDELRAHFDAYPAARISVREFQNGPPINAPVEIRLIGPDLEVLRALAAETEAMILAVEGARDVENPLRLQRTDLDLQVDTDKAALFGIPAIEVDRTVRLAIAGLPAGTLRETDGDEYPVTLRLPFEGRPTIDLLGEIEVSSLSGRQVPLEQVTNPSFRTAPNIIRRYNGERSISITAWPASGHTTDEVTGRVLGSLAAYDWPPGYRYEAAGELEAREEAFGGMGVALLVAMFGILAVLVLEFGSFRSTLIVFGVVPLGMVGAILALFLCGYTLSFTALIGLIALIGIEIKNSILLVDFTNQLRLAGAPLDEAIARAGEVRFLPILLTSLTAIGGLMPLALQGSGLYSPLAVAIIGGLISSTLLARLVTPVMYKLRPPPIG